MFLQWCRIWTHGENTQTRLSVYYQMIVGLDYMFFSWCAALYRCVLLLRIVRVPSSADRWSHPASLRQQTHTEESLTTCFRKGFDWPSKYLCVCVQYVLIRSCVLPSIHTYTRTHTHKHSQSVLGLIIQLKPPTQIITGPDHMLQLLCTGLWQLSIILLTCKHSSGGHSY